VYERLISDSRHDLIGEEWEVNDYPVTRDDDEYSKAILESMKNARTGDITSED
jgi:hypothetical protein